MKKHETGSKTKKDPDSRINKSLRKWNCKCGSALEFGAMLQKQAFLPLGTLIGAAGGLATGKPGRRALAAGRGAVKGLGADLGVAAGAPLGALLGLPFGVPGVVAGGVLGGVGGGTLGHSAASGLIGPYETDDEKLERLLAAREAAMAKHENKTAAFQFGAKFAADLTPNLSVATAASTPPKPAAPSPALAQPKLPDFNNPARQAYERNAIGRMYQQFGAPEGRYAPYLKNQNPQDWASLNTEQQQALDRDVADRLYKQHGGPEAFMDQAREPMPGQAPLVKTQSARDFGAKFAEDLKPSLSSTSIGNSTNPPPGSYTGKVRVPIDSPTSAYKAHAANWQAGNPIQPAQSLNTAPQHILAPPTGSAAPSVFSFRNGGLKLIENFFPPDEEQRARWNVHNSAQNFMDKNPRGSIGDQVVKKMITPGGYTPNGDGSYTPTVKTNSARDFGAKLAEVTMCDAPKHNDQSGVDVNPAAAGTPEGKEKLTKKKTPVKDEDVVESKAAQFGRKFAQSLVNFVERKPKDLTKGTLNPRAAGEKEEEVHEEPAENTEQADDGLMV